MSNSIIVERLKEQMAKQGLNTAALAKRANLRASFLYDVLSGKSANPSTVKLASVAQALGVSIAYLVGGDEAHAPAHDDYVSIAVQLIGERLEGNTVISETKVNEPYYFRRSWVRERLDARPENLRIIYIGDDGMAPTLKPGDMALVDISRTAPTTAPGIFAVIDEGILCARRLEISNASKKSAVWVLADNSHYPTREIDLAAARIVGRVVWFAREI